MTESELERYNERLVAEINRRRGEMSVAREALTECGVPAEEDGTTLTMSQRINRLGESRKALETVCGAVLDAMQDHYDGAVDSHTRWMGWHIQRLQTVLNGVPQQ